VKRARPILAPAAARGWSHRKPGDLLVAYSDGITEAEHELTGEPFDEAGLDGVITSWASATTPEISHAILDEVAAHVGDARVADDLTVLVVKRS